MGWPAGAGADFNIFPYSFRDGACTERSDPVTVIFYREASAILSNNHVRAHTGWDGGEGGGQNYSSHGVCLPGDRHSESAGATSTRYHIRMGRTWDEDVNWGRTTAATPHHEDFLWTCAPSNHAVDKGGVNLGQNLWSGFDQGRSRIYDALYGQDAHYFAGDPYWGNTQEFQQCDGDWAGSHGTTYWFRIPGWGH
jgi:hypothetical protein